MLAFWFRLAGLVLGAVLIAVTAVLGSRPPQPRPLLVFARVGLPIYLWLRDVDREREYRLPGTVNGVLPAWSPDGRWLAYIVPLGGSAAEDVETLYVYDLLTGQSDFVGNILIQARPTWSPDGRWLFIYDGLRTAPSLGYVAAGETMVRWLGAGMADVVWSPDGARLAYLQPDGRVAVLQAACLEDNSCAPSARLLKPGRRLDRLVGWMPDGQALMALAATQPGGRPYLYRVAVDSGQTRRLLDSPLLDVAPAWSPDGRWLAASLVKAEDYGLFIVTQDVPGLYLIDTQTGQEHLIYDGVAGQLSWTPSGDRLVFEAVEVTRSVQVYDRRSRTVTRLGAPGVSEAMPMWGVYRGRAFDGGWLLAGALALGALVVWVGRRPATGAH